ncbi:PREDICTED: uncharacterized protein LOC104798810 [Tarenaya hassleriana]|uniref:uncharacterized protein LOC104798810 n=1 Tax=Tarenaya hassleriana TaxID=28532 RepID=UPI00053C690C|nr:PREDICTED: uncharacterized protein LOC104798810 [Tarenaya hassleriana]
MKSPFITKHSFLFSETLQKLLLFFNKCKAIMAKVIVMKVHMRCERCRTLALKTAAKAYGVTSVRLAGEDRERVIVEGDRVDAVDVAKSLRKNVGFTQILSVYDL